MDVQRGTGRREGVIDADVDALWTLLTDWGTMDWWGNALEQDGMKVGKCYLEGEKGKIPRTKVLERANAEGAGLPIVNRETLIHEDIVARRLYYNGTDGFIAGVRNYLATWALDPLPDGRTKMHIASVFDVTEPGSAESVREVVEAVYDMIFDGLNRYFASQRAAAPGLRP